MIYINEPDPIGDLLRAMANAPQPTDFILAGVGAFVPDDGEEHYLADEAAHYGLRVYRYPTEPTHATLRSARTALGAGLLREVTAS